MRKAILLLLLSATGLLLPGQVSGRLAALISKGLELVEKGRYNDAINALEEVWEAHKSDPAVAENLGLAYLYGDRDAAKAHQFMETAIALGGRASFFMQHAHERITLITKETGDYCPGRLSITPGRLAFTAAIAAHSFVVTSGDFKEIKRNKWFGSSEGVWHIKTAGKKTYNLRPKTWSEHETKLVLHFIDKYLRR